MAICGYLEDCGHSTYEASNGIEAVALIEKLAGSPHSIQAVVTDMRMPRSTGLELLQAIDRSDIELPCLLHSSDASYADQKVNIENLAKVEEWFTFAIFHKKDVGDMTYIEKFLKTIKI